MFEGYESSAEHAQNTTMSDSTRHTGEISKAVETLRRASKNWL